MGTKPPKIVLVSWNANGLKSNRNELQEFCVRHRPDLVLVNETRTVPGESDPKLLGFRLYRTDRPGINNHGGGTAIYVRAVLCHHLLPPLNLATIETTAVSVTTTSGIIHIYSCYHRPGAVSICPRDLQAILYSSDSVLAAGDFNSKHTSWGCRITNSSGRSMLRFLDANPECIIHAPPDPTQFPGNHRPDILDIAVSRNVPMTIRVSNIEELSSNHDPIRIHVGELIADTIPTPAKAINSANFRDHIQQTYGPIPIIQSVQDMDTALTLFYSKFQESVDFASFNRPPVTIQSIPLDILHLIRRKNAARNRAKRTRHPADRRLANQLIRQVRTALYTFRNEGWQAKLQSLSTEDNSLWRMSKALRNRRQYFPPIHGPDLMAYSDEQKAEAFARSLSRQCSIDLTNADLDHVELVTDEFTELIATAPEADAPPHDPVKPSEVRELLNKLQVRKCPGPDNVPNRLLKVLPQRPLMALVGIFNAMFRYNRFPSCWKNADVIFIPKPNKNLTFPQNYRPISLLSAVGKIGERLILTRLNRHVHELNLIPNEQFGFRADHSTTYQVLRVTELMANNLSTRQFTGMVTLDVAKAFDTVWHEGLIYKLSRFGIPHSLVLLIHSYLSDRSFRARIDKTHSTPYAIEAGVPQGSVLSPTLFNIYTSDIPRPADRRVKLAIYADDTAVLATSRNVLLLADLIQDYLLVLQNYFENWLISVNAEKSSALLVTKRLKLPNPLPVIEMFGTPIPWKSEVKYLGVIIDKKLTFRQHIDRAANLGRSSMAQLAPLLCKKSQLSPSNKLTIYKAIVRPIMLYACLVWGHAAVSNIQKIQTIQNRALRSVFNAPWYVANAVLHHDSNIPYIKDYIRALAAPQFAHLSQHPNPLMRQAVDYDQLDPYLRYRRPKSVLTDPP